MDASKIKLVAMDLDGTLTLPKTPLEDENRAVLEQLAKKYKLIMEGASMCNRIFEQMRCFPIDIIGNYGMQFARYNPEKKDIDIVRNTVFSCDKDSVERRINAIRQKHGYTEYTGDGVLYHSSSCVTFPLLGTGAKREDKLAFDPDRKKRLAIYDEVKEVFSDYTVFIAGSSSFDMAPAPYSKAYALAQYCKESGIAHDEVVFIGNEYGEGGNDESVYLSDFNFIKIDNYLDFPEKVKDLL